MTLDATSIAGTAAGRAVLDIARTVKANGGRAWLVGGSVRDLLSGRECKDFDVEVFGLEPSAVRGILSPRYAFDECGVSYGVLKVKHLDIDVSLPRRETKCGAGHRAFDIAADPGLTVAEAASRRDFTVNAVYFDPENGEISDPYGGLEDLEKKILRHVSPKFAEDPLRVLRGVQFVARFDLDPAPETVALCASMGMEGLAPERIFGEMEKFILKGRNMSKGLEFLKATGWLKYFPELAATVGVAQDPEWHPEGDVWNHTLLCMDAFARDRTGDSAEDLIVGLAVLCHDFGKVSTTAFTRGRYRSPGHDAAGVEPALSFLKRLTNEERILKEVPPLVAAHMQPFALWKSGASDSAIRRLALRVGRIDRLVRVAKADSDGSLCSGKGGGEEFAWLLDAAARLEIEKNRPQPILMGRHLIEMGYKPSALFGEWLGKCFEAQLDGEFSDLEGAKEYFRKNMEDAWKVNSLT